LNIDLSREPIVSKENTMTIETTCPIIGFYNAQLGAPPRSGDLRFDQVTEGGRGISNVYRGKWEPGWIHLASFSLGGQTYVLAYSSAGAIAIYKINDGGRGGSSRVYISGDHTWFENFSHIVPFFQNGQAYMFTYRSNDVRVVIVRINDGGIGASGAAHPSGWDAKWTHIVSFSLAGKVYLLAYRGDTGLVAIERINDDIVTGTTNVYKRAAAWSIGWTHVVPFSLAGKVYLLAYREDTGVVAIDRINDDISTGTTNIYPPAAAWSTGWTHLVPFSLGDQPYILGYRQDTGLVAIDKIKDGGQGTENTFRGSSDAECLPFFFVA
jgi:hypothetical protein